MKAYLQTVWKPIVAHLRGIGFWIRSAGADELEFSTDSPEKAVARCSDFIGRPAIARVEVGIGRELADVTNPESFRRHLDGVARSFVRDGQAAFALSIAWADLLDDQGRIHVRVLRGGSAVGPAGKAAATPRDIAAIRKETVDETKFAVERLSKSHPAPFNVATLTLVCRDPDLHPWLSQHAGKQDDWTRTFRHLLEKLGCAPTLGFRAVYRFDPKPEGTAILGQGWLAIELTEGVDAADGDTVIVGHDRGVVHLRWIGLGNERIDGELPIALPLPAEIGRNQLRKTNLAKHDRTSLMVVSQRHPLQVDVEDGQLTVSMSAPDGASRPKVFLVEDGKEVPVTGKRRIRGNHAELLLGSESWQTGRSADGQDVRPVRIELTLPSPLH